MNRQPVAKEFLTIAVLADIFEQKAASLRDVKCSTLRRKQEGKVAAWEELYDSSDENSSEDI